eukprot:11185423-Lingulodinium_polyedra.AAC.1
MVPLLPNGGTAGSTETTRKSNGGPLRSEYILETSSSLLHSSFPFFKHARKTIKPASAHVQNDSIQWSFVPGRSTA